METKRFSGSLSAKVNALFMTLIGIGGIYFAVRIAAVLAGGGKDDRAMLLCVDAPMTFGAAAFTLLALRELGEAFAVYILSDNGVEKRSAFGSCSLRWQDVEDVNSIGGQRPVMILTDASGRKMRIRYLLVHDPKRELAAALDAKLTPQRERQAKEIGFGDFTHYPARAAGFAWLAIVAFILFLGLAPYFGVNPLHVRDSDKANVALLMGLVGGPNLLLGLMAATKSWAFRRGELSTSSLFGSTRISLDQIEAVTSRRSSNQQFNITTVQDTNGKKISFNSALPNYTLLRDYLTEQARPEAKERGAALGVAARKNEAKQSRIVLIVIMAFLLGFCLWVMWGSAKTIREYRYMDANGIAVMGRVTEKYAGSKGGRYLYYAFTVNGQEYRGKSPVALSVYDATENRATIPVRYMPDNPRVSHLTQSKSVYDAWFSIGTSLFILVGYSVLIGLLLSSSKRQAQQKVAD